MRASQVHPKHRRKGLTLIELVLVVAVLAILAGFIVPRLGFIRNLAGDSGNATIIADAVNQSVLYNTAEGHYAAGEDTLLGSSGAALDSYLNPNLVLALTTTALGNNDSKSLLAQLGISSTNVVTFYNQADVLTTTPNLDDSLAVTLASDGVVGTPAGQTTFAVVSTTATQGEVIYRAAYESAALTIGGTNGTLGTPNDKTYLLALGYGTNSAINGRTGLEPPVLFDKTPGEYTRPIFLLKIFGTGSIATGVPAGSSAATSIAIGFDGSSVASQLTKYSVDQNR
jgi:prepilin-type N-terminal cleavage/methylation domain-containing protein